MKGGLSVMRSLFCCIDGFYLGLFKKIGEIGISLIISLLLLRIDLMYIIFVSLVLAFISYIINFDIYTLIIREEEKK